MPTNPVRILHLTDPHLFADADSELRGVNTANTLALAISHIQREDWPADAVVMTGDTVQDDSADGYRRFRDAVSPLGLPVHCVPGNHDVVPLMHEMLSDEPFLFCAVQQFSNWCFIGVDSCVAESAGGRLADAEFDRLREALAAGHEHVAVCLHHPPVRLGSRWLDGVGLANGEEFLAKMNAAGNVRLVLFGHAHQAYDDMHGDVRVIGTPSTCRQFRPLSDEFSLDDKPPAYRRLTLKTDGSVNTELVWLHEKTAG